MPNFTAFRFVLSCLILGHNYDTYSQLLLLNNIKPFSLSAFYNILETFSIAIEILSVKQVADDLQEAAKKSQNGLIIMIDFGWGHKRESSNGALVVIDATTSKIVYYKVIEKCRSCRDSSDIINCKTGMFHGSSKTMEGESVKQFCSDMKSNNINISCVIHDEDSSTLKHIVDQYPNVTSYLDINHIRKNLYKSLMKPSGLFRRGDKALLKRLAPRINAYVSKFISKATSLDELQSWLKNIPNHLCNKHDGCSQGCPFKDPNHKTPNKLWLSEKRHSFVIKYLKEKLNNLVLKGKAIFHHYSSNPCESFHRMRIKYVSKNIKGTRYFRTRVQQAVLDKNAGKTWIIRLFDLLDIPEEEIWKSNMNKLNEKRSKVLKHHHTEEAKKQKANNKRKFKELSQTMPQSEATYGLSCDCSLGCDSNTCACKKSKMVCSTACRCINCNNKQNQHTTQSTIPIKKKKTHYVGSIIPTSRKTKCCSNCGSYFTHLEKCPYCTVEVCAECNGDPMCKCCVTLTQEQEGDDGGK
ncbi:predicted protein [Naegleria gruberi]|uniref:Predicted protein n=1 Tax=Naegleria gruberi TaxID=5762 RepID=D2VV37_NAEGR|nr:uncharacterized protein NAEGRDRAFT_72879 [Naegleria gruberi]EFC39427.1 predicted protein [Naegleria gruberi]|eukprot:XP_002672171.1 predicted protein [Naegleria gruberi strain NEG-M]